MGEDVDHSATGPLGASPHRKRDARRDQIVRACAALMREGGGLNTRLQDIAEILDLAYTALYYYFKSRDQLVADVLIRTVELRQSNLEQATGDSQLERLMSFLERDLTIDRELKVEPPVLYTLSASHRQRVLDARARFVRNLAGLLEAGVREGSIRPCHPLTIAIALQNIVERFYVPDDQIVSRARSTNPAELAEQLQNVLRHGVIIDRSRELEPSYALSRPDLLLGTRRGVDEGNDWLDELLRTATEAFNGEGFGASIPRMAERLGVSKTVYYRQFTDKQDLLFLCYLRGIGVVEASHRISELVATGVMDQALVHRDNLYRFHASTFGPFTALNAIDSLRPEQQRFVRHRNHGIRRVSERRWQLLQQQAVVHAWVDPVIVQAILGRLLYGLPADNALLPPDNLDRVAGEHQNLVYRGLAPL